MSDGSLKEEISKNTKGGKHRGPAPVLPSMAKKLKLASKEDIRLAIRKRGAEIAANMTDEEIYRSAEFISYATRLADFILRNHRLYSLDIQYINDPAAYVAYTDGKKIVWNTGNAIAKAPKLLERRFKVNMGILFHECSHKLFLDFTAFHKIMRKLEKGSFVGTFQTNGDPKLETAYQEIQDVFSGPYQGALIQVYSDICNCIDDGHDEAVMKRCFPGFIAECIIAAGEVQMETAQTLNKLISDRRDAYEIYSFLILQYAKYGYYKIEENTPETESFMEVMSDIEPIIDTALQTDPLKERWNSINQILLYLWPFLREKFPKNNQQQQNQNGSSGSTSGSQSGQGGSSGGSGGAQGGQCSGAPSFSQNGSSGQNGDPSGQQSVQEQSLPQQLKQQLEQLAQAAKAALNANPAPVNGTGNGIDPSAIQNGGMNPGSGNDAGMLAQAIAQAQAQASIQNELDKSQMEAIRNMNIPLIHKNITPTIIRHNPTNEKEYRKISKEMAPVVRNLVKEMQALLRELNEEMVQHHRRFGPIIEASEAYRVDNAFFAKKKLPADLPNMALCVLIDQSGSMSGTKLQCATKTAIMLEQFASELGIPTMIAGHNVSDDVNLRIFTDFVSAMTNEDRYALAGIESGGCNRDGLPLRICADLLAQRNEEVRLMIVISDGAPNDTGYRGKDARKDISDTVKEFRRKGLLIYGAAIDDDREVIQEIYGKGFLSIQDLASLPKTLVRLVRQQMV